MPNDPVPAERYAILHKQARAMRDALNDIDDVLGEASTHPSTDAQAALNKIARIIIRPALQGLGRRVAS